MRESNERNNCRTGTAKLVVRPLPTFGPSPGAGTDITPVTPGAQSETPAPTTVDDTQAPARPTLTGTNPASPSSVNSPRLSGSAEAGSAVKIYLAAACIGAPVATGSAAALAGAGIQVDLASDASHVLRATATDAAGNESACATGPTYVEDSTAPAPPNLGSTNPASPANSNSARVLGTAEAGAITRLYTTTDCTGAPVGTGTLAAPGIEVTVPADSATTFRATATDAAGNTSTCGAPLTYTEDSTAPGAPTIGSSLPSVVNLDAMPIGGDAELEGTITVWRNGSCSGIPLTVDITRFGALWSGDGALVADSVNTFTATVTDVAGNESPCSSAYSVTEDSTPPPAPTITASDPPSPSDDNTPLLQGTAEADSTVFIYSDATCSTFAGAGSAADFGAAGLEVTVNEGSTTQLTATARDAVGNDSACSAPFAFTEISPPGIPTIQFAPPGPGTNPQPQLLGSATPGSTVAIYASGDCSGSPEATIGAAQLASPGYTVTVAAVGTVTYSATATNSAATSACSEPATYERTSCDTYLNEDFSDNSAGWTLGTEWQIGPAMAGSPPPQGFPDPDTDATTATTDNGVAGMNIGGNRSSGVHAIHALASPAMATQNAGTLKLRFARWVNSDIDQFESTTVQVMQNFDWHTVATYPDARDNGWQSIVIDITPYKSSFMQIRFGTTIVSSGAFALSGWNVDDVRVDDCP